MYDRYDLRKAAADKALAGYDFGANRVEDATPWNTEDDEHDEWTCVLTVEGVILPYFCGFSVRFRADTAEVAEVRQGHPHSLEREQPGYDFAVPERPDLRRP